MRGTLHMLAAEDAGWIVGLLGPYFAKRLAGRRRQLGLDEEASDRGRYALEAVLGKESPLTRAELITRIADHGVHIDPKTQAPAHLLAYAAMTGRIQRGPEAAKEEPTYELADHRTMADDEALVTLAGRYLAGYGPATHEDFAAWSGLPVGQARAAFQRLEPRQVTIDDRPAYVLPDVNFSPDSPTRVTLLGHFDTYLLGYKGRRLAVPPEHDRRIQAGGGFINPAVVSGGQAVGIWRQVTKKDRITVTVEPFGTLGERLRSQLADDVADLGRFLEATTAWDFPTEHT